jgi:hypothetical protein
MRSVKKQNLKKPAPPAGIPAGCQPDYTQSWLHRRQKAPRPKRKLKEPKRNLTKCKPASAVSRVWSFVLAAGFPLPGLQSSFEDKTRKTLVGIGSCRLVTPLTQLKNLIASV